MTNYNPRSQFNWESRGQIKIVIFTIFSILFSCEISFAKSRALWATAWEINSQEKVVEVVKLAYTYNFDAIFAEIRYRADALYIPNKSDSTYSNPEKRSYFLEDSDNDFDPFEYLLTLSHLFHIKVYGWITTFVVTPNTVDRLPESHIYFQHPDWITCKKDFTPMNTNAPAGAFLDPGIDKAKDYTKNIILDIISNYNLDGIILDYVRYPYIDYGYNPTAVQKFETDVKNGFQPDDFSLWRQEQLTNFVKDIGRKIKNVKPDITFAITVKPEYDKAKKYYFQNWKKWLKNDNLDFVCLMIYTKSDIEFERIVDRNLFDIKKQKIGISIRAWDDKKKYPAKKITSKINLCYKYGFGDISLFHFGGVIENDFFEIDKF